MKISEVPNALKTWGAYWSRQRELKGFASVSITEQCCRILRTGIQSSGTAIHFSQMSDSVIPPDHIDEIDKALETDKFNAAEHMYLKLKYINKKNIDNLHTRNAEMKLSGILQ